MTKSKYDRLRRAVAVFVSLLVAISVAANFFLLSLFAVLTGLIFLALVRTKVKNYIDEREQTIQEKAAHLTYLIFAPTLAIGTFLLLFPSYSGLDVFSKGEFLYFQSLGIIFAYLVMFLITLYSLSYHFLNRRYGGNSHEKSA
jgi:uncharacterized membrane protein